MAIRFSPGCECCPTISCGACNNVDLFSKTVKIAVSGFAGVQSCMINNYRCCFPSDGGTGFGTLSFSLDASTVNGTYALDFQSGEPPPAGFASLCWWHAEALPVLISDLVCPADCPGFGGISLLGSRNIWYGIVSDGHTAQLKVLFQFGAQPSPCGDSVPMYFQGVWSTAPITVPPQGIDCLDPSYALNLGSSSPGFSIGSVALVP